MNEIGFETPALFRFFLEEKLIRILPYYNMLYRMVDLLEQLNLLIDRNMMIEESETARQRQFQKKDYSESQKTSEAGSQSQMTDASTTESEKGSVSSSESESTVSHVDYIDDKRDTGASNESASSLSRIAGETKTQKDDIGQHDTINEDNRGFTDFPQGNVANIQNQYYTAGENGNTKKQENHSDSIKENESTQHSTSTSEQKSLSNENSSSTLHSETDENMSYKYRDEESASERKTHSIAHNEALNERNEEVNRLLGELNRLRNLMKKEGDRHEYGLTGNRTIASMIEEYKNTWVNVDELLIEECRDLFMGVY